MIHMAVHVKDSAVGPSLCGKTPVSHDRGRVTCRRCLRYSPRTISRSATLPDILATCPDPTWGCPGCGTRGGFAEVFAPHGPGAQKCRHCPGVQALPVVGHHRTGEEPPR